MKKKKKNVLQLQNEECLCGIYQVVVAKDEVLWLTFF